jgi:ribosomal protein S18 acetylase RimI-like enzyme
MEARISGLRTDADGLAELEPLWTELHRHHRDVSLYRDLVDDVALSWARRLELYRGVLAGGGAYLTAHDAAGELIGYAMIEFAPGADDTFVVEGGIAEVVTLVVAPSRRSGGVGRGLLEAAEHAARERGIDTVKIAVMSGNDRAQQFYEAAGYSVAEHVLYRRVRASG